MWKDLLLVFGVCGVLWLAYTMESPRPGLQGYSLQGYTGMPYEQQGWGLLGSGNHLQGDTGPPQQ
jgi:hypothetical protein